ncbi:MAG: Gfo/Idh/MocA family oxidoreductase [Eubacterium sp.]|nr:Gfo/Idh/MocA family oxidoreductase [Eubacterium sp.]MBQ6364561.1 Gfo/Idh/MocA family oxidoreductase [Lachnospiraceae bacterium]
MKALMIGAGGIAHQHLKALKTLGTEIYGIYDLDPAKAAALAAQYGTQAFSEIGDKLQNADVIFLLTPPSTRLAYLRQIAGKCRNVFMEKPLAITVEDALEMEKLEQEYDMNCMVGFTQRFREGYRLLKGLLDRGELGEIVQTVVVRIGPGPGSDGNLASSWRTDPDYVCGMSIESLSHDIDFVQSLAGEIVSVRGRTKGTVAQLAQFDNNSDAVLSFASGAIGSITCSWSSALAYTMKGIIGTRGTAFLTGDDIWDNTRLVFAGLDGSRKTIELSDIFNEGEGYLNEDRYFLTCIEKGQKPVCGIRTGRRVLEISRKILETAAEDAMI